MNHYTVFQKAALSISDLYVASFVRSTGATPQPFPLQIGTLALLVAFEVPDGPCYSF